MNCSINIKRLRVKNRYTQGQLAEICGVSRQAVAKWESGTNLPDIEKILQLAELFQVSVDELLTGNKPSSKDGGLGNSKINYAANEKIVNQALNAAMTFDDSHEMINQFISAIGNKIGCDRLYIFEPNPDGSYRNTYEWCERGVVPQLEYLQSIPLEDVSSWLNTFSQGDYVFIEDVEDIVDTDPSIYRWLKPQGIRSLLVYPLFGGRSFLGVDNPAPAFIAQTSSLIEIMIHFVENMLQRRDLKNELEWVVFQNDQFSSQSKGIRYQINIVTGEVRYDQSKAEELGYLFKVHNWAQLKGMVSGHPEFSDHLMLDGFQKVIDSKENISIEFLSYNKAHDIRWNRLSISPFMDSDGTVLQLYGMLQDISDRHQIIEQYNKYISHLSGGFHICYLSRPIHLDYASDDLCVFTGYSREEFAEVVGDKYTNIIVEEDRHLFVEYVMRLAAGPAIESCEYRIRKKDGSIVQVVDTMESIADSNGVIYGYAYILDKTEMHAMLDMAEENERRQQTVIDRQNEVLDSLGKEYLNVFRVWLDEDKAQMVKLGGYVPEGIHVGSMQFISYSHFCRQYIQERVHPEDQQRMMIAIHPDTVRKAFQKDNEYAIIYRTLDNGETHFYQLKCILTTNSEDQDKNSFVAAFKNADQMIEAERRQREQLQNRLNIINAILQAFACGYYADFEHDTFSELANVDEKLVKIIGREGHITESVKRLQTLFEDKDAADKIADFLNAEALEKRFNGQKYMSSQLEIKNVGWFELYMFVVDTNDAGKITQCIFAVRDITKEKKREEEYIHSLSMANRRERAVMLQAYQDALTGVMNRNAYERDFQEIDDYAHVGFIYCDVNNLKVTNDTRGHSEGDNLLKNFADIMKKHFSVDCIYRIGGDEFVCMIGNIGESGFAARVEQFTRVIAEAGNIAAIGAAYGVPAQKDVLIREAEIKMYAMKCSSRK